MLNSQKYYLNIFKIVEIIRNNKMYLKVKFNFSIQLIMCEN